SRVAELLARTGLSTAAERRIGGYSGGMRQRLGIAQALLHRPQLLFLGVVAAYGAFGSQGKTVCDPLPAFAPP
ncbi:MAG TPA: ATP-binding cassette domain-containing protein, partial [Candidatus Limnocylindrales bacterium]|nr:ATP-binding cassette domain-containing protein [Candidatus Limnocylindrales bacterium]